MDARDYWAKATEKLEMALLAQERKKHNVCATRTYYSAFLAGIAELIKLSDLCGPVRIQIEGFRHIFNEVAFVQMNADGEYEATNWLHRIGTEPRQCKHERASTCSHQAHGLEIDPPVGPSSIDCFSCL